MAKDFRGIPKQDALRILKAIESLAEEPRPVGYEKLSTHEKYRVRQGVYRIIYEVHDRQLMVCVVKVGHRREVCL